ncbi:hypothetical protein PROFUN_09329 [Planoprotostelium fungivorum]|uniref:Uncharacterized protein n=1 Tax=Planoprotostelium fungivorum TaxID=1890364 RepID=A0A2P6NHC0_9EUKA|nr:hypothetical protein PROFUN_09329 [Planoprotostelium fungivorum]
MSSVYISMRSECVPNRKTARSQGRAFNSRTIIIFVALLSLAATKILSIPSEYRAHITSVELDGSPPQEQSDLEFRETRRYDLNNHWYYEIDTYLNGKTVCKMTPFEESVYEIDPTNNPIAWTVNYGVNTLRPCHIGDDIGRRVKFDQGPDASEMCVSLDGTRPIYFGAATISQRYHVISNWTVGEELRNLPPLLTVNDADCQVYY